jgi:hypothetical protein
METNSMTDALNQEPDMSRLVCSPLNDKLDALQRIYILQHSVRPSEAPAGYIIGHSRCGKSETAKRWINPEPVIDTVADGDELND